MSRGIYLDNNATTHFTPYVKQRLHEAVEADLGNPESPHSDGESARRAVAAARTQIADTLNVEDRSVIFTGSGSESNSQAILSLIPRPVADSPLRILTSDLEHSSVLAALGFLEATGVDVVKVRVTPEGVIDLDDVQRKVADGCVALVVQWANAETGVIQPIGEISSLARGVGARLHVDAAQAYGRIPLDLNSCGINTLTVTAHKIHGPKGIAALYCEAGTAISPVIYGGQQEHGLRGGTHNTVGICGFSAAVTERFADFGRQTERLRELRDEFEGAVTERLPSAIVRGRAVSRVPNTSSITFPDADGSAMVAWLDANGLLCSQTSACRSRRPEPSPVLTAMGLDEAEAYSTVRFSVSVLNEPYEMPMAADLVRRAYDHAREA